MDNDTSLGCCKQNCCELLGFHESVRQRNAPLSFERYHAAGKRGQPLKCIWSFITDRKEQIIIRDICSNLKPVLSAFPQGSILGPFLFTLYLHFFANFVRSDFYLFLDNANLYNVIIITRMMELSYNKIWQNHRYSQPIA